ncbi:MAG TPA: SiaB family protein kinase [Flavobacteriales bacterium]|nr:SiaB family protein kinase [Flavobacteriales bacterium]HRN35708.1 SiaB family protein kinase [Flavobacteriales bacterium]HRO39617.1 SiaB family protein kinase [Flavobacteriales bacterium]HRP81736.1 SiaB family protein kinase [Flavobacteriales bacterium]HRQ84731.1 SiaB family protein kinase [Flavobacteriales bacterium]
MQDRVFDVYDSLEKQQIMLAFKGDLSPELIAAILNLVEHKMVGHESDPRMRKRVFNVVMECLQNLFHHNRHVPHGGGHDREACEERQGVVMIACGNNGYSVLTGNSMARTEVDDLKDRLDRLNQYGPEQLRELYQSTLGNGKFTASGGGGLGLIDIARKSGGKLEYGFVPLDGSNTFFSLNVNLTS